MKVSTPPSYTKIFNIYNATGTLSQYVLPPHRALYFACSTAGIAGCTVENIDGTTGTIGCGLGSVIVPINISKISVGTQNTGLRIYGLL